MVLLLVSAPGAPAQTSPDDAMQRLYDRWHQALTANPYVTEASYLSTNGIPGLSETVLDMRRHRVEMAYFLCERLAVSDELSYEDANLFDRLIGMNMTYGDYAPIRTQNIRQNIRDNFQSFRKEWKEGLYRNPSRQIAELCRDRLAKERPSGEIDPLDVIALRRYGLFGVPALIHQVRDSNSKHAFTALMIILDDDETYRRCLKDRGGLYDPKHTKLEKVGQVFSRFKAEQKSETDLTLQISAALAN